MAPVKALFKADGSEVGIFFPKQKFDSYAEWDLRDIDFVEDDSDILHALKMAVVDIYHSRLKERQRRKKIIRDHGLINLRKFQLMER